MLLTNDESFSHEYLLEILNYNQESGVFTWKINRGRKTRAGTVAGFFDEKGYVCICTCGRKYKAHRLAWFYMTKTWPIEIDHKNRIRSDNRWCNLRNATRSENSRNTAISKSNKTGFKGVTWNNQKNKWQARAKVDGQNIYLGFFNEKEDAAKAYRDFVEKLHGEFFVGDDGLASIDN